MAKRPNEPPRSEITPEALYLRRREFLKNAALFTGATVGIGGGLLLLTRGGPPEEGSRPQTAPVPAPPEALTIARRGRYTVNEAQTSYRDITTYNNFYEFGTEKHDPAANAHTLRPRPWTVAVEG